MTRAQIQSQINALNRERQNCVGKRNSYKTSLNYANKLVENLNNANKYLDLSTDNLQQYFTISNVIPESKKFSETKSDIKTILNKTNCTIIPSINSQIKNLDNRISQIDREISSLQRSLSQATE